MISFQILDLLNRRLDILASAKPSKMDDILPLIEMEDIEQTQIEVNRIYYISQELKVTTEDP